jgi:hypothetical protein
MQRHRGEDHAKPFEKGILDFQVRRGNGSGASTFVSVVVQNKTCARVGCDVDVDVGCSSCFAVAAIATLLLAVAAGAAKQAVRRQRVGGAGGSLPRQRLQDGRLCIRSRRRRLSCPRRRSYVRDVV